MNIIEDDGQDQNLPQDQNQPVDPQIETYNEITEPILEFIKESGWRINQFQHSDGIFELSYHQRLTPEQYKTDDWGAIHIGVYFKPNIDNPNIPLNIVSEPYKLFLNQLLNAVPKLEKGGIARVEFNRIKIKVTDVHVKLGSALYGMYELIGTPLFNQKVRGVALPLGDMIIDGPEGITNELIFDETEIPKFDPNFKRVHDRIIKRVTTIVRAYQKGKWKGHTYDIGQVGYRHHGTVLLLSKYSEPVVKDGIIQPFTKAHLQLPSAIIDGYSRWSDKEQYPLSDDEYKEFGNYMNKIFAKFNITYN